MLKALADSSVSAIITTCTHKIPIALERTTPHHKGTTGGDGRRGCIFARTAEWFDLRSGIPVPAAQNLRRKRSTLLAELIHPDAARR
jgi:hypothetical protein